MFSLDFYPIFVIPHAVAIGFYAIVAGLLLVCIILSVAFLTVLERKLLASIQRRRGPNVVGVWGLLQAFADALKLLNKQLITPSAANRLYFLGAPFWVLVTALLGWFFIPFSAVETLMEVNLSLYFILGLSSLGALGILFVGWAGGSRYSLLGGLRAAAQLISYEIVFGFLFFPIIFRAGSASLVDIALSQDMCWNAFVYPFLFILFLVLILAETNRAPFDLPEAESELVAGFNVEYASSGFTMLFLAEYANMMLMSALGTLSMLGGFGLTGSLGFSLKIVSICCFIIGMRGLVPRYRYDQLMQICWGPYLTFVTFVVLCFVVLSPVTGGVYPNMPSVSYETVNYSSFLNWIDSSIASTAQGFKGAVRRQFQSLMELRAGGFRVNRRLWSANADMEFFMRKEPRRRPGESKKLFKMRNNNWVRNAIRYNIMAFPRERTWDKFFAPKNWLRHATVCKNRILYSLYPRPIAPMYRRAWEIDTYTDVFMNNARVSSTSTTMFVHKYRWVFISNLRIFSLIMTEQWKWIPVGCKFPLKHDYAYRIFLEPITRRIYVKPDGYLVNLMPRWFKFVMYGVDPSIQHVPHVGRHLYTHAYLNDGVIARKWATFYSFFKRREAGKVRETVDANRGHEIRKMWKVLEVLEAELEELDKLRALKLRYDSEYRVYRGVDTVLRRFKYDKRVKNLDEFIERRGKKLFDYVKRNVPVDDLDTEKWEGYMSRLDEILKNYNEKR